MLHMCWDYKSNHIISQSAAGSFCSIFTACLTPTPTPRDLTTPKPNSGILHALPNLVMLFNCLAFPKVTTFACSFGAFDFNVSVSNMSFSGADVRGLGLVRAVEVADRPRRSILNRSSVIFSACHFPLDLPGLINAPTVYTQAAELQFQCTCTSGVRCAGAQQALFD